MNDEQLKTRAAELAPWYHQMELAPGLWTESNMTGHRLPDVWRMVRGVREGLDYRGATVLDVGTMSGMWAFEAERLGARTVIAADIYQAADGARVYEQFLLAREAYRSRAVLVPNGDAHRLYERLDSVRLAWRLGRGFDIIQCLGVLYHLQNPLLALRNLRRCAAASGWLLLETACFPNGGAVPMMRGNADLGIYHDRTTYWSPNQACLFGLLRESGWEPELSTVRVHPERTDRICLLAKAVREPAEDSLGLVA